MDVWIGCLACYGEGRLVGDWWKAGEAGDVTSEQVHAASQGEAERMIADHEELWIMDVDNAPHPSLAREMSPTEAQKIADALDELDSEGIEVAPFFAYVDHLSEDWTDWHVREQFQESYAGEWDSREDFAQNLADEIGFAPEGWPASYIDWETATRDLFMDYFDEPAENGGIYVFRYL